jgi:dynein heavy chain
MLHSARTLKSLKKPKSNLEENTEDKLNKTLLFREEGEEGFVQVNFDPLLVRLLREVKYLLLLDIDVPSRASYLYSRVEIYRTQTGNLELIVNMYNDILATLLPVEKPLLKERIERMNSTLSPGIEELKWNSQNIDPFIKQCMEVVKEVDDLVKKMKENVRKMQDYMVKWSEKPLFERKNKPMIPDDLEQTHQSIVMARMADIKDNGKEIHKLMKDTADNVKPDKKSPQWLAYVDYVNGLVIEGMTVAIVASLNYLSDQINISYNKHHQLPPMFDIKVDLVDRDVTFDPPVAISQRGNGIKDIIMRIINDFIAISIQMIRLDSGTGDYLVEIKDQFEILGALSIISLFLHEIENETFTFIQKYEEFSFLWKEELEESFQAFLDTGDEPSCKKNAGDGDEEEDDESYLWMSSKILNGVTVKRPTLEKFDEKVTFLTAVKNSISDMRTPTDIGWLRVNSQPLKNALENIVNSWISKYTNFLLNNTVSEIRNIETFINEVSSGIKEVPLEAKSNREKELLMKVMTHLRDVKMIKDHTLLEIEPMRNTIVLLKKHGVHMDEDFLIKLDYNKTTLTEVSEKALGPVKEQILPLQNQEARNIRKQLEEF